MTSTTRSAEEVAKPQCEIENGSGLLEELMYILYKLTDVASILSGT